MTTEIIRLVKERVYELSEELVSLRRKLHMNPEIGFDTIETEAFIREYLAEEHIETIDSSVGVLAIINGRDSSGCVALRADIDALPLQEKNETEYRSVYENRMHACGHDGHTAMLLAAAKVLNEIRGKLPQDVLLIFQPAEEGPNLGGARIFMEDFRSNGLIEKIRRIHALHLTNDYETGKVKIGSGAVASSTDEFHVKINGKSGHAAEPHKCVNALTVGLKAVSEMESFMARRMDPFSVSVFSVGKFQSGTARNIIPGSCEFEGTVRCRSDEDRAEIKAHLEKTVNCMCKLHDAKCEIDITDGLPPLIIKEKDALFTYRVAEKVLGKANVEICIQPGMYAEDFAYFAESIPASYIWIGSGNAEKGFTERLHSQKFDFDENALSVGATLLCGLAAEAEK